MTLFDSLVDAALDSRPELASLRPAVEKEILHHDILRELGAAGLLDRLTFIGGTCLRDCYGSVRLSEDLDFTGGVEFDRSTLSELGRTLERKIGGKYGLSVRVSDPVREEGNVATWKLAMTTRPGRPDLPSQRINIDVCAVPSHDTRYSMLRNHYSVDLGTSGLVLAVESREELYVDKLLALALRPNRPKFRDVWDLVWLSGGGIVPGRGLVASKLADRAVVPDDFIATLEARIESIAGSFDAYRFELGRFLPSGNDSAAIDHTGYWSFVMNLLRELPGQALRSL